MTRILGVFLAYAILLTPVNMPHAFPQDTQVLIRPLQYEVSVILKLIHVYVTDKKGNPVKDLSKDDFVLTDEGKPVVITDFEKHVLDLAADQAVTEKPPVAAVEKIAPENPAVRQASRKFFFFFDFAFNNARGIVKAKKAALHFLESQVRPDDEVGVLSYSMLKGVTVHEYLSRDLIIDSCINNANINARIPAAPNEGCSCGV